jgi:hypothetical protein
MGRMKSDKGPNYKKKGRPAGGEGEHQVGLRDVGIDNLEKDQKIAEKYTEGDEEDPAENIQVRHPNQNTDKPDIDKPPYS